MNSLKCCWLVVISISCQDSPRQHSLPEKENTAEQTTKPKSNPVTSAPATTPKTARLVPNSSTPSSIGYGCNKNSDCVPGAHCVESSCALGPCEVYQINHDDNGNYAWGDGYRYDDEGYEISYSSRFEERRTSYGPNHATADVKEIFKDDREMNSTTRKVFDDDGRLESTQVRMKGKVVTTGKVTYDPSCFWAGTLEVKSAAGVSLYLTTTACNKEGRVSRIVSRLAETNPYYEADAEPSEIQLRYDPHGLLIGRREYVAGSERATDKTYSRDKRGWVSHYVTDTDSEPVYTRKDCWKQVDGRLKYSAP